MSISPDFGAFAGVYDAGKPQVVSTKLVADLETPGLGLSQAGRRTRQLLPAGIGRRRIGARPLFDHRLQARRRCGAARKGQAEINRHARTDARAFEKLDGRPLETLRTLIRECQMELPPGLPPMASGLFGFLGYDMVRDMERLPDNNPDPIGLPDAIMVRPTLDLHLRPSGRQRDLGHAGLAAGRRLGPRRLSRPPRNGWATPSPTSSARCPSAATAPSTLDDLPEPQANMSKDDFKKMVETCKEYIRAGDAFQIVPSQRFSLPFTLPPLSLYRSLRRINPSPFLIFFDYGDFIDRGLEPGDPGAAARQHRSPSARWPAPSGAARRLKKTSNSPTSCWPTPRSMPST